MPHFFDLPREVRDLIYGQYVISDGGYVLDFESNTLKCANGDTIDLAFMLTCKAVANELRTVPFSTNTLNFSTICSEEHRVTAGRFGDLIMRISKQLGEKLHNIYPDNLSVPDDVWEELTRDHPKFAPYLGMIKGRANKWWTNDQGKLRQHSDWRNVSPTGCCGETPSVFRDFSRAAMQTILAHKDRFSPKQFSNFQNGVFVLGEERRNDDGPYPAHLERLVGLNPDPWEIPTRQRVDDMMNLIRNAEAERMEAERKARRERWDRDHGLDTSLIKYHYSAAAVAIRFLKSLSRDTRLNIRKILLKEERMAVAFSECHGLGLIPFCQENPQLRVERRVNMWRTILPVTFRDLYAIGMALKPSTKVTRTQKSWSSQVAIWAQEALELEHAGMPPGSFTLTIDGDSSCAEIFREVVQRDAVWQQAIDACFEQGILPPLRWDVRRRDARDHKRTHFGQREDPEQPGSSDNSWYVREGFPQAIHAIVAGTSVVKCNFWLGHAWDVEQLVEENKGWTMLQWKTGWHSQFTTRLFEPDPPSPSWIQLLCDDTLQTGLPRQRRT